MTKGRPRFVHRGVANLNPAIGPRVRFDSIRARGPREVNEGFVDAGGLNGALLAMSFRDNQGHHTTGSAVMIGPGLALCAAHVLHDEGYIDRIQNNEAALVCTAPHEGGQLSLWTVARVTVIAETDLAILGMFLSSDAPLSDKFSSAEITTRMPSVGDELSLYGFSAHDRTQQRTSTINVSGEVHFARGKVTQVFPSGRDRVMLPGPCIEVNCNALGGMSGGPVFDHTGCLVGVVSSSFEGIAIAYVSHLWPALVRGIVEPVWPVGHVPGKGTLLYLGRKFGIVIERPDAFQLVVANGEPAFEYVAWS